LLQRDGSERPQHKPDEEADKPHDAVGDTANAGREHLGSQGRTRAPEAEEPEAPSKPEDPEPEVARGIDPERHEDGTPEQQRDKADAAADLVGEPAGRGEPEKADEAPENVEGAVLRRRPMLFGREIERHPGADRAIDAGAATGDEGRDQGCRQYI